MKLLLVMANNFDRLKAIKNCSSRHIEDIFKTYLRRRLQDMCTEKWTFTEKESTSLSNKPKSLSGKSTSNKFTIPQKINGTKWRKQEKRIGLKIYDICFSVMLSCHD